VRRRAYLTAIGTGGLAATAGCLDALPGGGSGCGQGDVAVEDIRTGGYAGEEVTVTGKLDYTLVVGDGGIRAFRVDGQTGTTAVFLTDAPGRNLEFGDCLTVQGTVRAEDERPDTDGPVIENATLQ
jgi:hypothetical protein